MRKSHEDGFLGSTLMSSLPGHRLRIRSATNSRSQIQVTCLYSELQHFALTRGLSWQMCRWLIKSKRLRC